MTHDKGGRVQGSGFRASVLDFSRRADLVEEMDRTDCDQTILFATLRQFELTNILFSRYRTLLQRYVLADIRRQPGRAYQLTDLGAGGCDVARWLVRVCRREKLKITVRAIEQDPRMVRYAHQANAGYPEIEVIEGDACDPACWGTPDYVFAQHLLHHLPDAACRQLLEALDQVAPRQFIISDLIRSRIAYHAFRLAALPLARGTFIVEDGALSIRRGFLEPEVRQMVSTVTLKHPVSIYRLWPARLAIVGGEQEVLTEQNPPF
ncbi:MAG: methyltransferase domain-containing protein [bacterium]